MNCYTILYCGSMGERLLFFFSSLTVWQTGQFLTPSPQLLKSQFNIEYAEQQVTKLHMFPRINSN